MIYPLEVESTTIDPAMTVDPQMTELLQNVAEGLVAYDERNRIAPLLAETWDVSDRGRTYTFHIRKGVTFSNGRPLVADDFRWTWERNLAPKLAAPLAIDYLGAIVGAKVFAAGKADHISGIRVLDDSTLQVTIEKPRPYFLGDLVVASAVIAREAAGPKAVTSSAGLVGTGPYKLVSYRPNEEIRLDANRGYWQGPPRLAHIRRPIVLDPATRLNRFLAGDLDLVTVGRQEAAVLSPNLRARLRLVPIAQTSWLSLGQKGYPPFRDVRVRQAFAMSIDRNRLVTDLLSGTSPAFGLIPHGVPGYDPSYRGLPFDPARARALLAEAGYPGGRGLPSVELSYSSAYAENRIIAEAAATDLARYLNVRVKAVLLEQGALFEKAKRGALQMGIGYWAADYLDPQNFVSMQVSSSGPVNRTGFRDLQVDALCAKADGEANPDLRLSLYRQAERRAVGLAARIPIFMTNAPILISGHVKDLKFNALSLMSMASVQIK